MTAPPGMLPGPELATLLGPALAGLQLAPPLCGNEPIGQYLEMLWRWNPAVGLVAAADPQTLLIRHIVDSLALLRLPLAKVLHVVDVGSGAGLPGLVLALARPEWQLTLLEANRRKCAFLRDAVAQLDLAKRVTIAEQRVEDGLPAKFGLALSRAAFAPTEWLVRARSLLQPAGAAVVMFGRAERSPVLAAAREAGFQVAAEDHFELPFGLGERHNLLLQRCSPASALVPREVSQ